MKKRAFYNLWIIMAIILASLMTLAMTRHVQGPNRTPIAQAGEDQVVAPFDMVALDGSQSYDPDGDKLTYQWKLIAAPQGADARLFGDKGMNTCRFTPNKAGTWLVRLTVCDGKLFSVSDVVRIQVKEPSTLHPFTPVPRTSAPDLEIAEIQASGVYQGRYVKDFKVRVRTRTGAYGGPLDFRVLGLSSQYNFAQNVTIQNVGLTAGEENKWLTLFANGIEWPEDVCAVTFAVTIDPNNRVEETNERNNQEDKTIYRDELVGQCDARIFPETIKIGKANLRPVSNGGRFVLPSDTANIFIQLRNCCPVDTTMKLAFLYDWTPLTADGENKKVKESTLRFKRGESKALTFSNIKIPKKSAFKTLAIRREHANGYDILYTIDVRVDY
jgi:hypothetical protein